MTWIFKTIIILLIIFGSCLSCTPNLQDESSEHLNKTLRLDIFNSVNYLGSFYSYEEFRNKFDYISAVFLRKGCKPCELKISEWKNIYTSFEIAKNYTVLFIIQGYSFDEVEHLKSSLNFDFNFIVDIHCRYLTYNKDIPYWVLDSTVLIDAENKIKLIGFPFSTLMKFKQFKSIIKN